MSAAQEKDRLPAKRIAGITVVTLTVATMSVVIAALLVRAEASPARSGAPHVPGTIDPTDFDHVHGVTDSVDAQRQSLERWGWTDRDAGLAEIPIEDAIDLLAGASDGGAP